jgi:hypothetical protein
MRGKSLRVRFAYQGRKPLRFITYLLRVTFARYASAWWTFARGRFSRMFTLPSVFVLKDLFKRKTLARRSS